MKFKDNDHEQCFLQLMSKMKSTDAYHRSTAYLMALVPMVADDVFDFRLSHIKHDGLYAPWQTGSSRKATRLMFSLWNGTYQDLAAECPEETSCYYTVDEVLNNHEYFPWFIEAIRIRFEWNLWDE